MGSYHVEVSFMRQSLQTYNVDKQVPDSAATATAYLCGIKTNFETIGIDSGVPFNSCPESRDPAHRTPSVLRWAQEAGKHTGNLKLNLSY